MKRVAHQSDIRWLDEIEATRADLSLTVYVDSDGLVDAARRRDLDHVRVALQARNAKCAVGSQESHK